ncbi:hypothetical protein [Thermomonospora umbrina]|uniref:Uncharacterized protein n=1 Tax=Thermomonospora umbrina TaxID=111806 RepID=A0A3D9SSX4_9ACTN|nr:hypothetical protein [Thermomonospora umbrina]REE97103.1 hypothetical protein DFJ69_2559 [Thermomonospora umbrina]
MRQGAHGRRHRWRSRGSAVAKALDSEAHVVLIDPRDAFVDLFTGRFAALFGLA